MSERIEVGDIVDIEWSYRTLSRCKILDSPVATGDSWHVEDENGNILYVQQFDSMRKVTT